MQTRTRVLTPARPDARLPLLAGLWLLLALMLVSPALAQSSMFTDFKARAEGDVITIILAERTAAQRESEWQNQNDSKLGGSADLSNSGALSGRFALDAKFSKEGSSRNQSVQSDLLSGTMTALVVTKGPTGNLILEGERRLNVNGETHVMKLHGTVRPSDIRTDNTIFSYQIANASIEYRRAGGIKRSLMRPGRIARFGAIALLGGAIFAAMQ